LPDATTTEDHARELAAFAIGKTKKSEEVDRLEVLFRTSAGGLKAFHFVLDELRPAPQPDPAAPADT
jgi:hypothetical protein